MAREVSGAHVQRQARTTKLAGDDRAPVHQRAGVLQREIAQQRRLAAAGLAEHQALTDVAQRLQHGDRLRLAARSRGMAGLQAIELGFVVLVRELACAQALGEHRVLLLLAGSPALSRLTLAERSRRHVHLVEQQLQVPSRPDPGRVKVPEALDQPDRQLTFVGVADARSPRSLDLREALSKRPVRAHLRRQVLQKHPERDDERAVRATIGTGCVRELARIGTRTREQELGDLVGTLMVKERAIDVIAPERRACVAIVVGRYGRRGDRGA